MTNIYVVLNDHLALIITKFRSGMDEDTNLNTKYAITSSKII